MEMKLIARFIHQSAKTNSNISTTTQLHPNIPSHASLLQACTNIRRQEESRALHAQMLITGIEQNDYSGSKLVGMYAKTGSLADARLVFEKIPRQNVISWNVMIRGYVDHGDLKEALRIYNKMQIAGMLPDYLTFPLVLKACAGLGDLQQGKDIHDMIMRLGFESNIFVGTTLIDMYVKCRTVDVARQVFDGMSDRNVVSWTAMIVGYVQNGLAEESLELFRQMHLESIRPCVVTISGVLPACAQLKALRQGKEMHNAILKFGFETDDYVLCSLIDMYAKCGDLENACRVFDTMSQRNVVLWTSIIAGCAQNGNANEALRLFKEMRGVGLKPNPLTVSSVLPACAHLEALQDGQVIHDYVIKRGLESNPYVTSALIDMYVKCRHMEFAHQLFDEMSARDVVSWSAMISGYAQNGHSDEALKLFRDMLFSSVKPNSVSIASVLSACAHLAALQQGKEIHDHLIRNELMIDDFVGSSLINMYAKCGSIHVARQVFDKMFNRDVVSWNAIILGYGMHGYAENALALFCEMQQAGVIPDHISFIAVLSACSHAGFVDEGCKYFDSMSLDYHITPRMEHYACLVDLLGRSGHLDAAYNFIKNMPIEPSVGVWGALLGACRIYCNVDLGEYAAKHLFQLEPEKASYYVLMSHIYAEAGKWDGVAKMRTMMRDRGLKKNPGCSWIEVKNKVHAFVIGDKSHPQWKEIYSMIEKLDGLLKRAGYVQDTNYLLHGVDEGEREYILCGHG